MRCTYFKGGEISHCTAFPNSFRPSSDIAHDYCNSISHKNCPFYTKAIFYSSVMGADTEKKRISVKI